MRDYKGGDFDRHFLSAHIGPRRLIDARTEASLLVTVDRQWTAGMPEIGPFRRCAWREEHRLTPRLSLFGRASAARRNCRDCNHLDGPEGNVLLGAVWAALPILRLNGHAGWNWTRANSEHWRHGGPQAGLAATLALPAGFTVGLHASLQRTEYQGSGFPHRIVDGKPREDETRTLSASVHNRAFTVAGFSPRLSLIREERDTNAQASTHKRNRAELSSWSVLIRNASLPFAVLTCCRMASLDRAGTSPCLLPVRGSRRRGGLQRPSGTYRGRGRGAGFPAPPPLHRSGHGRRPARCHGPLRDGGQ